MYSELDDNTMLPLSYSEITDNETTVRLPFKDERYVGIEDIRLYSIKDSSVYLYMSDLIGHWMNMLVLYLELEDKFYSNIVISLEKYIFLKRNTFKIKRSFNLNN